MKASRTAAAECSWACCAGRCSSSGCRSAWPPAKTSRSGVGVLGEAKRTG
ncbi:hypothetical protein F751_0031 [Auxenochlorella protothecoides]|uniref:Uncharacterized protein n=1 Tax=Auxenochlorella protothecoides TaxID=3075 RepID=A0A087S9T2_AUXPR|nr:hypothetical protein F751_0031 [Auxenochlorella protothecoides]KFM22486.1 hypothetical protein F751_0031 [Auxenochlorella protothecoides]